MGLCKFFLAGFQGAPGVQDLAEKLRLKMRREVLGGRELRRGFIEVLRDAIGHPFNDVLANAYVRLQERGRQVTADQIQGFLIGRLEGQHLGFQNAKTPRPLRRAASILCQGLVGLPGSQIQVAVCQRASDLIDGRLRALAGSAGVG